MPAKSGDQAAGIDAAIADLLRIRPLGDSDVPAVCALWSSYVSEGFIDNFSESGGAADGDVGAHFSLDRWGPGVSMPMLPGAPRPNIQKEPSYAVSHHLAAIVGHPTCRFLVAELVGAVIGFITYRTRLLPTNEESVATIDELYVDRAARRAGIGTALVRAALADLRGDGIGLFRSLVPASPRYAGVREFFSGLGWEPDKIAFSLYD